MSKKKSASTEKDIQSAESVPESEKIKDVVNETVDEAIKAEDEAASENASTPEADADESEDDAPEKADDAKPAAKQPPEESLKIMQLHHDAHNDEKPAPEPERVQPHNSETYSAAPRVPVQDAGKAQAAADPRKNGSKRTTLLAIIAMIIGVIAICFAGYDIKLKSQEANMLKSKAAMEEQLVMTVSADIPVISTKNGLTYSEDPNPIIAKVPDQLRPYIGQYPSEGDLHIDGLEALNLEGTHTVTFVLSDTDQYGQTVEKTYSMMVEVAEGRATLQAAEPSASPEASASADPEASASASASPEPTSDIPDIGIYDTLGPGRDTYVETPTPEPDDSDEVTVISEGQTSCEESGGSWNEVTGVCNYN